MSVSLSKSLLTLLTLAGLLCSAQAAANPELPSPASTPPAGLSSVSAAPGSVTVRAGDTAYSLARLNGLSVEALLALNGLTTPDLQVGQVLRVSEGTTYTVQKGDTLYSLSRRYGLTVDRLLATNGLPTDVILEIGQVLRVPGSAAATPAFAARPAAPASAVSVAAAPAPAPVAATPTTPAPTTSLPRSWRDAAMSLLGIPYVFGGTSMSGLDCSGFVLQVFSPQGVQLPRRSADQAQTGVPVGFKELQPGDLVFFDTVGRGEVTHVGIYLGDDQFVNANSYKGRVVVDHLLTDAYWAPRLLSARRVLPPAIYGAGR